MKRIYLLLSALLLVVFAMPSQAAWNIRQKDTGAAVWTDGNSVDVPTGPGAVFVAVSNVQNSITHFVVTHKPGKLKKVYAIANNGFATGSNNPVFNFLIAPADSAQYRPVSTGATLTMVTTSGLNSNLSFTTDLNIDIAQGGSIAVYTATTGIAPNGITFTIVIE